MIWLNSQHCLIHNFFHLQIFVLGHNFLKDDCWVHLHSKCCVWYVIEFWGSLVLVPICPISKHFPPSEYLGRIVSNSCKYFTSNSDGTMYHTKARNLSYIKVGKMPEEISIEDPISHKSITTLCSRSFIWNIFNILPNTGPIGYLVEHTLGTLRLSSFQYHFNFRILFKTLK